MKHYNLIWAFVGAALIWASAAEAIHSSPEDFREEIYNRIMTSVSFDKVDRRDWSKPRGKRRSSAYSTSEEHKTLAVCINWDESNHDNIIYYRWWYSTNSRLPSYSKRSAMLSCKQSSEKKYGCTCEVVDQDDENVLVVPEDFLALYAPITLASALVGSNQFDGAWEGSLRCGDCENCAGPLEKNLNIEIENGKFDVVPDLIYMGKGVIDKQGNVRIRGTAGISIKIFSFHGTYDGESFILKGQRGPLSGLRKCTIELSRATSPVEATN